MRLHELSRTQSGNGLELPRKVRRARVARDVGNFFERARIALQQFLDSLHLLGYMVFFERAPLYSGEYAAHTGIGHAELLLDARRELQSTFGLIAHMVHYGTLGCIDNSLVVTRYYFESEAAQGVFKARAVLRRNSVRRYGLAQFDAFRRYAALPEGVLYVCYAVPSYHILYQEGFAHSFVV